MDGAGTGSARVELQRADGEQPAASSARRPAALPGDTAATTSSPAGTCPSTAATSARAPAPPLGLQLGDAADAAAEHGHRRAGRVGEAEDHVEAARSTTARTAPRHESSASRPA